MARDQFADRFAHKQEHDRLDRLSKKTRSAEDIEAEEELIANAETVEPLKADAKPGRNDPCSCGSGKKYKRCCGRA